MEEQRGFPDSEYAARMARAQAAMHDDNLDALVVTTPANFRYFCGFATRFWESPTRPWFLVLPREGRPIAVVPEIGAPGLAQCWVEEVRTWPAPVPQDDGVSLVSDALAGLTRRSGRIGWEMGRESVIRMPISDFDALRQRAQGLAFVDGSPAIWSLRQVKSPGEVARIRRICEIASDGFDALAQRLRLGDSDHDVARTFQQVLAERGADCVPFLAVCAGPGGYGQIIVGPAGHEMRRGDVLFVDLGATYDGYFCDFDRNFAFGSPDDAVRRAHEVVWQATEAGIAAARPGASPADLWRAMSAVLDQAGTAGGAGGNVGRLGHGLGLQLTEPPSNMPGEETALVPGMVMTIEPGLEFAPGRMLVHEEDVVITEDGCELLTRRAPRELPVIDG